ncbi:MAG: ABC transporter permease subunit, partial [Bacteroidota bacterium]
VFAFVLSFVIGAGIPLLIYAPLDVGLIMILIGVLITTIFVALAFLSSVFTRDKAKGIGMAIMLWLFFALLFDGMVLFLLFQFSDYPIEKFMVIFSALNPIDLSRILILMHLDVSAMMGYTGAIFKQYFGTDLAISIVLVILLLWTMVPFIVSLIKFKRRDL